MARRDAFVVVVDDWTERRPACMLIAICISRFQVDGRPAGRTDLCRDGFRL